MKALGYVDGPVLHFDKSSFICWLIHPHPEVFSTVKKDPLVETNKYNTGENTTALAESTSSNLDTKIIVFNFSVFSIETQPRIIM